RQNMRLIYYMSLAVTPDELSVCTSEDLISALIARAPQVPLAGSGEAAISNKQSSINNTQSRPTSPPPPELGNTAEFLPPPSANNGPVTDPLILSFRVFTLRVLSTI